MNSNHVVHLVFSSFMEPRVQVWTSCAPWGMWVSVNKLHFCGSCILATHVRPPFRGTVAFIFGGHHA